jgi:molecular chaperone DnaK (HSP70)
MKKENIDEIVLVGGCTRMPQIKNNLTLFFNGKEPNTSVNPDEVVAAGAAIQGYILSHKSDPFSENITLLDVIPLSLGVETIGGVMNVIIPRNTCIPITKKRKYTNDADDETYITVKIFEGERKMTKDNFLVGEFELTGITPSLRGINQFEITFSVDVNGIINVTALDKSNVDNKHTITINSNKGRLSSEKIKELVEEAKNYEVSDRIEREKKTLYYTVEDLICTIKANIDNPDFKLKDIDKKNILTYVNNTLEYLKENPYKSIDKKEYVKLIEYIKTEYGTLILKVTGELDNIKTNCSDGKEGTSIYEDGDEEDKEVITKELYEELENNELGIKNSDSDEIKKEIRRLRDLLVSLCYSIFDILSGDMIEKHAAAELKEYVNDILLWVYVKEKIKIEDYQKKIEEVNNICNDIVDKNINTEINTAIIDDYGKSELEQLCFALLGGIQSNTLGIHNDDKIIFLRKYIDDILDFIIENDGEYIENMYYDKINELNKICDDIYENDSNYTNLKNTHNDDLIINDIEEENCDGTSIFMLMKKNKHL